MKIAIIGLGYVGLPLAMVFAEAGTEVVGIEAVPERCDMVNAGESYIQDVAGADLRSVVEAGIVPVMIRGACGGVRCRRQIRNVTLRDNGTSTTSGGGMYFGGAKLELTNVVITGNTALYGGGLYLEVLPGGSKVWRYKYHRDGKREKVTIGPFPSWGIKDARDRHEQLPGRRRDQRA